MAKQDNILKYTLVRLVIYLVALTPLIMLREFAPSSETSYLSIAEEAMCDNHTWCMYSNGEPYTDNPPLYFWIIMMVERIAGEASTPMALAFFSLIPAFIIVSAFGNWCRESIKKTSYRGAAEITLMSTAWFLGSAVALSMEMLFTMFVTLAMVIFWRFYLNKNSLADKWLFGICVLAAMLTKGPIGLLLPLAGILVFLALDHNFNMARKVWGWRTWVVLICGCAIWWISTAGEGGPGYLKEMLLQQTIGNAVTSPSHPEPPYYYLCTMWYAMGPWSVITIGVIVWALIKKIQLNSLTKFFLVSAGVTFVILSLAASKLQSYLLPCFGFITYAAYMIIYHMAGTSHRMHVAARLLKNVMLVGSVAILAAVCLVAMFATDWVNSIVLGL